MKNIPSFQSFINESKGTWFPQEITVLKDIYVGKNSDWTSIGDNTDDFVIEKGEILNLSKDGSSNKNKEATYKVRIKRNPSVSRGKRIPGGYEEDYMTFTLKELSLLVKQSAISISSGFFGHDLTFKDMI